MGSRLPSAEEVLIIRPTGKKGRAAFASQRDSFSRRPARKPGIPKQDPDGKAVQTECSCCVVEVQETRFPKKLFPESSKEPY